MNLQTKKQLAESVIYLIEQIEELQKELRNMRESNENPNMISPFSKMELDDVARQIGKYNESINKTIKQMYEGE